MFGRWGYGDGFGDGGGRGGSDEIGGGRGGGGGEFEPGVEKEFVRGWEGCARWEEVELLGMS